MTQTEHACRVCAEAISRQASECPHCGHTGINHTPLEKLSKRFGAAWLLTLTLVGAVLGLPLMLWYSLRINFAKWRHPEWTRPAIPRSEVTA